MIFQDFHGFENGPPYEDTSSHDYILDHIIEHNGWTTVQFRRLWDTCDSQDFKITVNKIFNNALHFQNNLHAYF